MIKKLFYLGITCTMIFSSCVKKDIMDAHPISDFSYGADMMAFATSTDLQSFVENIGKGNQIETKSSSSFQSLWDYQQEEFLAELDEVTRYQIAESGLIYEPEDDLIVDPSFAKVLNPKREIQVGDKIYRYVPEGILIYNLGTPEDVLSNIDLSSKNEIMPGNTVNCCEGVFFQKIIYAHKQDVNDTPKTKATVSGDTSINNHSIVLGGGIEIPASNIQRVLYEQDESDANGVVQWISGIFGTNVVAIKEFDSKHRISMRTFSQDYGIYKSVGMAVRFQQKVLGSWFRYKAEEIRYGWTAVECIYRYRDGFSSDFMDSTCAVLENVDIASYGDKDVVFFKIALSDISGSSITNVVSNGLNRYSSNVNSWVNAYPSYRNNPRGVMAFDYSIANDNIRVYDKIRMVFPQGEEVEYDDRREQVNWDFNWFPTLHAARVNLSNQYYIADQTLSPLQDISITRGEFYGAVKYEGRWMACVIYNN